MLILALTTEMPDTMIRSGHVISGGDAQTTMQNHTKSQGPIYMATKKPMTESVHRFGSRLEWV